MTIKLKDLQQRLEKLKQYMIENPAMKKNLRALQALLKLKREIIKTLRRNGLISSKEEKKLIDDLMRAFALSILCMDLSD